MIQWATISPDESKRLASTYFAATYALAKIAYSPDGAQALIKANTLELVLEMLESRRTGVVQWWTCALVRNLVFHEETIADIMAGNTFEKLMSLLRQVLIISPRNLCSC